MIRKIVKIDAAKCTGCGQCVDACHEGAIGLRHGKAVLLRDDYCDGLGDCLPACPEDAISFETREALPYDEAAVEENMRRQGQEPKTGCPGSRQQLFQPLPGGPQGQPNGAGAGGGKLRQWPVQIRLVPANAAFLDNADLLIAADCTAFAYGNFHAHFMDGRITLIGCPKLDPEEYREKLAALIAGNSIRSIMVARMSVPCCSGLEQAVAAALRRSGKSLPCRVAVLSPEGALVEEHPCPATM